MPGNMTIQELLEKGLFFYGLGDIEQALELWREVIKRDPDNETAREYIEIETGRGAGPAERETRPEPEAAPPREQSPAPARTMPENFIAGQNYLHAGRWQDAARAFDLAQKEEPDQHMHHAHAELARARLIKEVIDSLGGGGQSLSLKTGLTTLALDKSFTQEEGFVLSLISGDVTLEDVIALSPIPDYQTYLILHRMIGEGLILAGGGGGK